MNSSYQAQVERALEGFSCGGDVVIAVPDATRPIAYGQILPPLLQKLSGASSVTVLVALGLHRPMTQQEAHELQDICDLYGANLRQHDPDQDVIHVGEGWFPEPLTKADALIAVGLVEPHQYAGFSGGAKTFAIGCAGRQTIESMHSLALLQELEMPVGRLENNPFQDRLWRMVDGLPELFQLLLVPSDTPMVFFGKGREIHAMACEAAKSMQFIGMENQAAWMILDVPPSKSTNFYQASRAATYVSLVESPAVKDGGALLLNADCPEGMGSGSGERAFVAALLKGREQLARELHSQPPPKIAGGAQRAYVLVQALQRVRIALIREQPIPELLSLGIPTFRSVEQARQTWSLEGAAVRVSDPFHQLPFYLPQD